MNAGDIAERILEAYEIQHNSGGSVGPKEPQSVALPYVHDFEDKRGWGSERLAEERKDFWQSLSRRPSARQISEADEAISWFSLVTNSDCRVALSAWALSMTTKGVFFEDECVKLGIHRQTGRRRKDRAISQIVLALGGNALLHNEEAPNSVLPDHPETDYFADNIREPRRSNGITSWADGDAFRPFVAGAETDFSWSEKRNEQRRQRRAARLKKQAA